MKIRKLFTVKNKSVNQFFIKLAALFLLIVLVDFSLGKLLRYYYFKQESGLLYRTTYSMEKTKDECLVFGSSRANHHYRPDIFEKKLHQSYYNVGRDGLGIFYHYAVLKSILKRYTPKTIVLDLIAGELDKDVESYDRLSTLLPYYKSHPEIRSVVELKSPFEKYKLLSSVYPYNSLLFTIAVGNSQFNKARSRDIKGYVPLNGILSDTQQAKNQPFEHILDPVKVKILEDFIKTCREKKVNLYIVCSPYYNLSAHFDLSLKVEAEIARKLNVNYIDYSADTTFINHNLYFSDEDHLNDTGARIFSERLTNDIINLNHRSGKPNDFTKL